MAKRKATTKPNVETVKLADEADLLRLPPGVKDEQIKKGGKRIRSISITDIPEAGYLNEVESVISLSADKFKGLKKYNIQPFDVLMSIQGTVGNVGVVPESFSGNWMANISLLVVRFHEAKQDNAVAFTMFMKSAHGREIIKKLQKGDSIKRINVKELASVEIPEINANIKKSAYAAFEKELSIKKQIDDLRVSMEDVRNQYLA